MSGIFGIFNRNGEPVEEKIINAMLNAMSYWEPDDKGTLVAGSVALGHTMLWNTPESKLEHLPNRQEHLVITMDARLDNREELVQKLEMTDRALEQITDSDFILAAYSKWGEACPKYLLGDFAFAIWDEKKQQLFCARDHIGIKSFYFHLNDDMFVFSNDIRGVITHHDVSKVMNDEAVAIYLTKGELWHPAMTFFEYIQKLPPATSMIISSNTVVQNVYWKAENSPKVRFDSLEEYSEKLRELLEDSVEKRLRSEYPIASHLSGGLDSSTISTISARYLHSKKRTLQVYNWVQAPKPEDDYEYYEWANSRRIAELENVKHSYIELNAQRLSEILSNHDIALNDTTDLWYEFLVRQEAKKENVRSILSGWGGDELITYGGRAYYSDMFRQGKIISAIIGIYKDAKKRENVWRSFAAKVYYKLIMPFFPSRLYCFLPKIRCEPMDFLQCADSDFVQTIHTMSIPATAFSMRNIRKDQLDLFTQGHIVNRIESWASSGYGDRIEYSYPLLDKRIVEFALGIPSELYLVDGKPRFLFKHAISGLLPEDIRWGSFKLEENRVNLLSEIEKDALSIWLDRFKKESIKQNSNAYINYTLLKDQVELLDKMKATSLEDKFSVIDTILKSILVLNLGHDSKNDVL